MKDIFLIKHMLVTEKATMLGDLHAQAGGRYVFLVKSDANKSEIKKAVHDTYRVDVVSVNTINIPGKTKRFRTSKGKTSGYKKAVVTLKEGQKIETK